MDKIAAYELLLENHPLWTKEALIGVDTQAQYDKKQKTKKLTNQLKGSPDKAKKAIKNMRSTRGLAGALGAATTAGAAYLGYKALTKKK